MNNTKVTVEGKDYILNLDKAREMGLIEEVFNPIYPLKPGDIYTSLGSGRYNNLLLIEAIWNQNVNASKYQLLGMGVSQILMNFISLSIP